MSNLRIAVLTAPDAMPYRDLMLHAYAHAADAFTSTPEERAREPDAWWVNRVANPAGLMVCFGAFVGTDLVGTVALEFSAKPKTRHKAQVVAMFVREQSRGLGIGRALLQAAIDHCVGRDGILLMQLQATEGNEAALSLYRNLGFATFGTEPMAVLTAGGYRAKVRMWLDLASRRDAT